jgi:large subunit ribosomal protein L21
VYAIVRNGHGQTKVEVGDVIEIDAPAQVGATVQLPAVLVVDGDAITSDADALAGVSVTAEVLGQVKGPKIRIQQFKNKSGYKRRLGHRQRYSKVKVLDISA